MRSSEVYLRAAEMVATRRNTFSCVAIADAIDINREMHCWDFPQVMAYERLFDDTGDFGLQFENSRNPRNLRVLALCLMAAIAEDDES